MNKKSQAALEFLTTYAWAFLVIMIMIGALAYFGILRPSKILPDRCNFGVGVNCLDHNVDATGNTFRMRLKNGVGEAITIPAIASTGIVLESESVTDYDCTLNALTGVNGGAPPLNFNWNGGDILDLYFSGCNSALVGFLPGDKAKVLVTINYYLSKSGTAYSRIVEGEIFTTAT